MLDGIVLAFVLDGCYSFTGFWFTCCNVAFWCARECTFTSNLYAAVDPNMSWTHKHMQVDVSVCSKCKASLRVYRLFNHFNNKQPYPDCMAGSQHAFTTAAGHATYGVGVLSSRAQPLRVVRPLSLTWILPLWIRCHMITLNKRSCNSASCPGDRQTFRFQTCVWVSRTTNLPWEFCRWECCKDLWG